MLDAWGKVIYVGKAKNLKKRVTSYFQRQLDSKTLQLVKQIKSIQVTITRNEREALLLESNLIKELLPRYNVIFRDDKSYPYLYLSTQDKFPRLSYERGLKKKNKGKYFGPYPSARLARDALNFLQRIFKLRQCDNTFFNNRVRPCLQYQIKRCTAPCVDYISKENYQQDVRNALLFLEGKNQQIIEQFMQEMEKASEELDYERAARLRDQVALLRSIQEQQIIFGKENSTDVLGVALRNELGNNLACIHVLMIREGKMMGTRHYFPNSQAVLDGEGTPEEEMLEAFILQHYCLHDEERDLPKEILVGIELKNRLAIEQLLMEKAKHAVDIAVAKRTVRMQWLQMATLSAEAALKGKMHSKLDLSPRFEALQEALQLESIPQRLECFDVSHTGGEATVASCVVFDVNGPLKDAYRRYNIRNETPGDDYGALRQALTRHYIGLKSSGAILPDILFIDGGKGQLAVAAAVLEELQVAGVMLVGVAKGEGRKPGLETLFIINQDGIKGVNSINSVNNVKAVNLPHDSPALHVIQKIRDEAHRFAITAHRKQRAKRGIHSSLENIPGIGKERRMALLKQFGGLQEVLKASMEELSKAPGISKSLAERIYQALHGA
jgi:excinuclease ABC subunit C